MDTPSNFGNDFEEDDFEDNFNFLSDNHNQSNKEKKEKFHILVDKNKLMLNKQCKTCTSLFEPSLLKKIYSSCITEIKEIISTSDLNLDFKEVQCLVHQLYKAEIIILNKLTLICYELQMNQSSLSKILNKFNIIFPFQINQNSLSELQKEFDNNKYIFIKYQNKQFLLNTLYRCTEFIHNIIFNIEINRQTYCQYYQIMKDVSSSKQNKLNDLLKLKKQVQSRLNLQFEDIQNDFPVLEQGILYISYINNKNRHKVIEQAQHLFKFYPNIKNLNYLVYYYLYNQQEAFQPVYPIEQITNILKQGDDINKNDNLHRYQKVQFYFQHKIFNKTIQILNDILENENVCDIFSHQFLFYTYLLKEDFNMAIVHLRQIYLDSNLKTIQIFNLVQQQSKNDEVIVNIKIQIDIIQFILIYIVYSKLELSNYLFMSSVQHWDLFLD